MDLDAALQTFIAESRELLADMENALLNLDQHGEHGEAINAIFRAAHTIKGSSGLFGLDHVVAFTHVAESVLDEVRDGKVQIDDELVVLLLSCCDHLNEMVEAIAAGQLDGAEQQAQSTLLVNQLGRYLKHDDGAVSLNLPGEAQVERIARDEDAADHWHISLRFGADVLRNGMDPLSFIRYLGTLGRVVGIATLPDALPTEPAQMDPESCYLGFEIAFASSTDKATIEGVFEFVRDDCALRIVPPRSRIAEFVALINELPEKPARLGEILVACGSVTERELDVALNLQAEAQDDQPEAPPPPLGKILVDSQAVQPAVVEAALNKQKQASENKGREGKAGGEARSIRIDADRLDQLITLVGELIIAGASTDLLARQRQDGELIEATSRLTGLVQEVRDSALQLRMVKIGATFGKFQRVVHDVARELGKDIALSVSGEDTELDKTVVEKIGDPLMHLVRNAMDHGIEPAEIRDARGKPPRGTVSLNAFHDSGSIVIEVSDDGGGLKRERILAKAIERGLVEPGEQLSDSEVFELIFEPGFSTAEAITNLSGRGVGMDVVKRNIQALRGSVGISSQEGAGTTVSVRLPLTLAIIDGFMVKVGDSVFVVPLDMIHECIEFSTEPGHDYCNLRGEVLPLVKLRDFFEIEAAPVRRQSVVVIHHAGQRAGLVVDALLGEFQTVIKPLSKVFQQVKCISGSTILGTGAVALILDIAALLHQTGHRHHAKTLTHEPKAH
ncbi:chemotaxis protein CheA [Pelomonas sp. SE-A7]|uniref:chemotaxis protein CheA n=1 Tax=Pelomonas sp. SE-A7 TaxID=3054953 RepID=UPI00259C9EE5|nr:chemotaxis protein CheA [Pelomonas sp. SE-A7]MDM4766905.1 chemotaxis protein CheA [Pelomonas sp. SE-A7]